MRTLIIRGSEWLRKNKRNGTDWKLRYEAKLRNKEGKMCCLGILGRECGVKNGHLIRSSTLAHLLISNDIVNSCVAEWTQDNNKGINNRNALKAMRINDMFIADDEKIKRLKPIFKDQGWEIDWRPNE